VTTTPSHRLVHIRSRDAKPPSPLRRLVRSEGFAAVASPLFILAAWEALVRGGALDARFFPTPTSVMAELVVLIASGRLFVDAGWTVLRVLVGTLLGAVPALILGVLLGLSPVLRAFVQPAINAFYPIPKVALLPLVMMLFGIGEISKWVIVAIAVFFQMFFSTLAGVANIERIYLDVATNFRATRWQVYWTIALPGALPFIFTGLQLGVGMAIIVVVIAENFGTQVGIGFMIWRSWQVFEVRDMYIGLIVVAFLGYAFQLLLQRLQRKVIRWKGPRQ
jgi:ABC-type nitrate/sulfonate/bicarbonate transport system permease component